MSLAEFKRSTASKMVRTTASAVFGLYGPDTYHRRHKPLNRVGPTSNLGELFANGRATHNVSLVDRKPREVLPGIWSFDPPMMHFLEKCVTEWNKKFPVALDAEGFSPTGVHANFDKLLCPAGYLQTPMSAKAVDNGKIREELKLLPGYTLTQRNIAEMLWKLVWSRALPSPVNVPKASAGGMRRFSHDVQWKLDYARWKTEPANYDRYLNYVENQNVWGLANDFEIVFGMYVQKRLQLDSPGRERVANDWLYAKTGGLKGGRAATDKVVDLPGGDWKKWSALRVRVIDAGPWTINCDLQIVASAHMKAMFKLYPDTFHVNTDEQIKAVVDGKYVFCSDVSEYDQSMSKDAIEVVFSTMREYYPEGIVRAAERLYQAPYFAKPLDLDGTPLGWILNPMDWSQAMNAGNRSGHAMTSLVAKINKVAETLMVMSHLYPVNALNLEKWLNGDMPMGMVNNGDDEIVWALSRRDLEQFKLLRADLSIGHYKVEPEPGMGFSGRLLVKRDPSALVYTPTPRLQTPIEKMYVPERSIGGLLRQYWPVGWFDRIDALHKSDAGRELWDIHNHYFRSMMEPHYGEGWLRKVESAHRKLGVGYAEFSDIDREILVDPDKLHYKYSESDISNKAVLTMITSNIPADYCAGFLRRYYKGTFV